MVSSSLPAIFGDYPTKHNDYAPSIVAIVVFAVLAAANFGLMRLNKARNHKFRASRLLFNHALARCITFGIRLEAAEKPTDEGLQITSNVLIAVGVIALYTTNLIFAQRIFTAAHPSMGTRRSIFWCSMIAVHVFTYLLLIANIVVIAVFYGETSATARHALAFHKAAMILYVVIAAIPLFIIALTYSIRSYDEACPTMFADWIERYNGFYFAVNGDDGIRASPAQVHVIPPIERGQRGVSIVMVALTSVLLVVVTAIRTSSAFVTASEANKPWQDNRITLYVCVLAVEAIVSAIYTFGRADLKFYIPDRKPSGTETLKYDGTMSDLPRGYRMKSSEEVGPENARDYRAESYEEGRTGRAADKQTLQARIQSGSRWEMLSMIPVVRIFYKMAKNI